MVDAGADAACKHPHAARRLFVMFLSVSLTITMLLLMVFDRYCFGQMVVVV